MLRPAAWSRLPTTPNLRPELARAQDTISRQMRQLEFAGDPGANSGTVQDEQSGQNGEGIY